MKNIQHPATNTQTPAVWCRVRHWTLAVGGWGLAVPKSILVLAIRLYRLVFAPAQTFLFGSTGGCRFTPTCSQYAMDAVREHGAAAGTVLAVRRICRCHPWGGCGHDPVPPKKQPEIQAAECPSR